jgi:hypothetical protein
MTQNVNDTVARTRRSVLLAAAGSAAAATAVALGRPARALAADNDPMLLGADNHAESITALHRDGITQPNQATLFADTTISAAIVGHATTGQGVIGRSINSAGVQGYSETDAGVNGFGVYGVWATGENFGLFGTSTDGDGVHGETANGNGGSFKSDNGNAISTDGRLHFDRVSGVATIAAGDTSKVVSPGTDLTAATFVLLTPRSNLGGRDLWYTVDAAANTFRIRISKAMGTLKVGWLLID